MKMLSINDICERVALDLRQRISGTPTEENLDEFIEDTAKMLSVLGQHLSSVDKEKIKNILNARLVISMDTGVKIVDEKTYKPWLAYRKAEIDEYYWKRYEKYLLQMKGWNDDVVATLDNVGDDILDLLGNPSEQSPWSRKGLILGDIQSGKTSNYIALINKAADADYKLIILLTGTLEALRRQTQERVDEGFVGLNSRNALSKDLEKKYVGVGMLDKQRTAFQLTDIISDFDTKKLQAYNFSAKTINEPIILVVKKNTTVLKNLFSWINTAFKDTQSEKISLPLLLIDDEADNASVNTKKPEQDPTAINSGIRKILRLFNRSTYVAVTATPFANIFIDPSDAGEVADLFPSDFIYSLSPPSHYIGSNAIFGDNSNPKMENCIEIIADADGVFSSKDRSAHIVTSLPVSLIRAIDYFLLCNVIRDIKSTKTDHRSMLVNVSQYTFPQEQTFDLIDAYLDRVQKDIKHYSKLPFATSMNNTTISTLFDVFKDFGLESKSNLTFAEILSQLTESTMPIKATMVNTRTKAKGLERLDYEPYTEKGYRVIAVGGNSLSRGITLEGLCVSYFYRESKMYDTLLQMGRWFGYRPGYEDIVKVWMSNNTMEWYAFITKACNELRSEISYMNKLSQTPREFGLKVREHPDTLMITASNKMRTAKPFETWISLSGKLVETPWLTTKTIDYNYKHTVNFLENITSHFPLDNTTSEKLYENIPSGIITEYVRNFASHPGHLVFNAREIGRYIENNSINLGDWCVLVATGKEPTEIEIAGISINRSMRGLPIVDDCIRVSGNKSRVGSVGTTKITLTEQQRKEALNDYLEERAEKERDGRQRKTDKVTVPDHIYLRYAEKPILIIYLMVCNEKYPVAKKALGNKTIVALGLGFPRTNEKEEKAYYKVNMIEYQKSFNNVDFDLEGDEDED